jgi:histidine triad (HIT) family protein
MLCPLALMRYTFPMKNCIFCKIISGEVPSTKIYEDDKTCVLLDINPVSKGHVLVIPKHTDCYNIFDIPSEDWSAVCTTVQKIAIALEKALHCDGVNLIMNNREHAGQVVDHPHVHLIPRYKGDGLPSWPHKHYNEGEAAEITQQITAAL